MTICSVYNQLCQLQMISVWIRFGRTGICEIRRTQDCSREAVSWGECSQVISQLLTSQKLNVFCLVGFHRHFLWWFIFLSFVFSNQTKIIRYWEELLTYWAKLKNINPMTLQIDKILPGWLKYLLQNRFFMLNKNIMIDK